MDFEATVNERVDSYSMVAVRGEVDLHTAPEMGRAIERGASEAGVGAVIVDLSGVELMDSAALSTLIRARDATEKQNISLRLVAPSKAVERILSVTGLNDYFDVFPSCESAIPDKPA